MVIVHMAFGALFHIVIAVFDNGIPQKTYPKTYQRHTKRKTKEKREREQQVMEQT